jgi:crossover junction endodeoxyribonuclease RuvC
MIILGIDPGTITTGYGVIEAEDDEPTLVDCGALSASERSPIGERLSYIYQHLLEVIARFSPDVIAIERPFLAKNVRSALAIGQAQAIAILAAAEGKIPTREYTPAEVKQRVTDYGASSKEQVQEMVKLQLKLAEAPHSTDAADALAVALCHLRQMHLDSLLAKSEEKR